MRFTIHGRPVSQKNAKQIMRNGNGRPFIGSDRKVKAWHKAAAIQLREQIEAMGGVRTILASEPTRVCVDVYQGARQSIDLDNAVQAPLDALQAAGVFANDYCVTRLECTRIDTERGEPRVEIFIETLKGGE
jgi:Holliday junction resolvase RusA-like endonuclease